MLASLFFHLELSLISRAFAWPLTSLPPSSLLLLAPGTHIRQPTSRLLWKKSKDFSNLGERFSHIWGQGFCLQWLCNADKSFHDP